MQPSTRNFRPVLLANLMAAALLVGCDKGALETNSTAPATDPNLVTVSPDMARSFKTGLLAQQSVSTEREVPARLEANERLVTRIGASVTGRVTDVYADIGARVQAGQVLARISSSELTNAQLAYLRANSDTTQAERAVERAQLLIRADVIGAAELQRREAELALSRAELRAAADHLLLLGVSAPYIEKLRTSGQLTSYATITANRSGVVIERKVSQGQVAQPGDPLFTVADLSKVWVVGALPEQAARSVQRDQTVDIEVPAIERQLRGKVVFVSDTIQPETRTVAIRTEVDNPHGELKPQMLATLRIAGLPRNLPVVPETAVVRDSDRDHVFVQVEPNVFRLTPVELAPVVNHVRPVLKGLEMGTTIVTEGGFHLNNDRLQRLLTGGEGGGVKK